MISNKQTTNAKPNALYEEKEFKYPDDIPEEDQPQDYMSMLSLFFGVVGLMLKLKIASWIGVLCCVSSLLNLKTSELDLKQVFTSLIFSVMGLFLNYFGPNAHMK